MEGEENSMFDQFIPAMDASGHDSHMFSWMKTRQAVKNDGHAGENEELQMKAVDEMFHFMVSNTAPCPSFGTHCRSAEADTHVHPIIHAVKTKDCSKWDIGGGDVMNTESINEPYPQTHLHRGMNASLELSLSLMGVSAYHPWLTQTFPLEATHATNSPGQASECEIPPRTDPSTVSSSTCKRLQGPEVGSWIGPVKQEHTEEAPFPSLSEEANGHGPVTDSYTVSSVRPERFQDMEFYLNSPNGHGPITDSCPVLPLTLEGFQNMEIHKEFSCVKQELPDISHCEESLTCGCPGVGRNCLCTWRAPVTEIGQEEDDPNHCYGEYVQVKMKQDIGELLSEEMRPVIEDLIQLEMRPVNRKVNCEKMKPDIGDLIQVEIKPDIREVNCEEMKPDIGDLIQVEIKPDIQEVNCEEMKPDIGDLIQVEMKPDIGDLIQVEMKPDIGYLIQVKMKPDIGDLIQVEMKPDIGDLIQVEMKPDIGDLIQVEMKPDIREVNCEEMKPDIGDLIQVEMKPDIGEPMDVEGHREKREQATMGCIPVQVKTESGFPTTIDTLLQPAPRLSSWKEVTGTHACQRRLDRYAQKESSEATGQTAKRRKARKYPCSHCDYQSTSKACLEKHIQTAHGTQKEQQSSMRGCGTDQKGTRGPHRKVTRRAAKKLTCPHCDFECSQKKILKQHMLTAHGGSGNHQILHGDSKNERKGRSGPHKRGNNRASATLTCPSCDFRCSENKTLKQHVETDHEKEASCLHCRFRCHGLRDLKQHMDSDCRKRKYQCLHCTARFKISGHLTVHITTVHRKEKKYHCPDCQRKFAARGTLNDHIIAMHENKGKHACPHCHMKFSLKRRVHAHVRAVHEARKTSDRPWKHSCPHCSFKSAYSIIMRRHIQGVHDRVKNHSCPHCDFKCILKYKLKVHIETVHEHSKMHACPHCSFKSPYSITMKRHIQGVHDRVKNHSCPHCDFKCILKYKLKVHIETVHEHSKKYACPHCSFKSAYSITMKQHIQVVHDRVKNHSCPHCDFKCILKYKLKVHIETVHEHSKKYACPHCSFKSPYSITMKRHIQGVHDRVKNHSCPHCDYRTGRRDVINKHVRHVHEGQRRHACPHCQSKFSLRGNMKKHMRSVHNC